MKNYFAKCMAITAIACEVVLTGCSSVLSRRQRDALTAFDSVMTALPAESKDGWFQIAAPDGGAIFAFSNDGASLAVDASPFIAAGLDAGALDNVFESVFYQRDLGFSLPGWDMLNQNIKDTAYEQFKADMKYFNVRYNDATGCYSIDFEQAMFVWSDEITCGERCIIFLLDPEPLLAAGVDPGLVNGWNYVQTSIAVKNEVEQLWRFQKKVDL